MRVGRGAINNKLEHMQNLEKVYTYLVKIPHFEGINRILFILLYKNDMKIINQSFAVTYESKFCCFLRKYTTVTKIV